MTVMEESAIALAIGTKLAEYRIEALLGEGGFGLTYLAFDENLHKKFAIKEYLPWDFATRKADGTVVPRTQSTVSDFQWGLDAFINEARILAKFHNPHIVQVFRFFKANGTAYIVMEYVEGSTLTIKVRELNTLDEKEVKAILLPIMDGLADVHDEGVWHRDIKPDNIMIRDNGKPVLIDFGAARLALGSKSRSITTILTPGYAPLEQYSEKGNFGPWSDIYSLAGVAYFCLTQTQLKDFSATDRVLNDTLPPLAQVATALGSQAFLQAIDRALSVVPGKRPQNLEAFVESLMANPAPEKPDIDEQFIEVFIPDPGNDENLAPPDMEVAPKVLGVEKNSNRKILLIVLAVLVSVVIATFAIALKKSEPPLVVERSSSDSQPEVAPRSGSQPGAMDTSVDSTGGDENPPSISTASGSVPVQPDVPAPPATPAISPEEQGAYERAQTSRSIADLSAYLDGFPNGSYTEQIQQWLQEAQAEEREHARERQRRIQQQKQVAWNECAPIVGKEAGITGRALFAISGVSASEISFKIGNFPVRPNSIASVGSSNSSYNLCGGVPCFEIRGNFGEQPVTIIHGVDQRQGSLCFYYLDEKPHVFRVNF